MVVMGDPNGRNSIALRKRGPWLYITVDDGHRMALLRGDGAKQVIDSLGIDARYSTYGRGYVVQLADVPDVVAYCEHRHQLVVIGNRKPPEQKGAA